MQYWKKRDQQNTGIRNKLRYKWSNNIPQGYRNHSMKERQAFQLKVLRKRNTNKKKNLK